jgi:hypothetical protein
MTAIYYICPPKKGWFFWRDLFYVGEDSYYSNWQLGYMRSESDCLDWIRREVDHKIKKEQDDIRIKKFERDNPVRYITVDL